jgi:hypothetical protein
MLLVGLVLSERVLSRLGNTQESHLIELSQSYLDGLSSAITPSILREDNWEIFDAITRMQTINKSLHPMATIVTNAEGAVIAASDPRQHPVGSIIKPARTGNETSASFSFSAGADSASAIRVLSYPGRVAGIIYATFDTRHLAAERRDVVIALAFTNGILTLSLAVADGFCGFDAPGAYPSNISAWQETLAVPFRRCRFKNERRIRTSV